MTTAFKTFLSEEFGDTHYTVRRLGTHEYEVAKFTDKKHPDSRFRVEDRGRLWYTDSPGFRHRAQQDKHIKLVKQWIADGEPDLSYYTVKGESDFTLHKFDHPGA